MKNTGRYVIFRESREDFLYAIRDGNDMQATGWCVHPRAALTYGSREEATKMAQRLANGKGCKLAVCELAESDSQIALADACEVWPVGTGPIN